MLIYNKKQKSSKIVGLSDNTKYITSDHQRIDYVKFAAIFKNVDINIDETEIEKVFDEYGYHKNQNSVYS